MSSNLPQSSFWDLLASDDFEQSIIELDQAELDNTSHPTSRHKRPSSPTPTDKPRPEDVDDCYGVTGFGEGHKFGQHKRRKLEHQHQARRWDESLVADRPQFFQGLAVYVSLRSILARKGADELEQVNGLTEDLGLKELQELIVLHGGTYVRKPPRFPTKA